MSKQLEWLEDLDEEDEDNETTERQLSEAEWIEKLLAYLGVRDDGRDAIAGYWTGQFEEFVLEPE